MQKIDKISQESKAIKKKPMKGIEVIMRNGFLFIFKACPKNLESFFAREDNSKELTGLLDKEVLKKGGGLEFLEKNTYLFSFQ